MAITNLPGVYTEEVQYPYRNKEAAEKYRSLMATIIHLQEWMEKLDELPVDDDKRAELQTAMNHLLMEMTGRFMKEAQKPERPAPTFRDNTYWTTASLYTVGGGGTTSSMGPINVDYNTTLTFDPAMYTTMSASNVTIDPGHINEIKEIALSSGQDVKEEGR